MGILDLARADVLRITSDPNGFAVSMKFDSPSGQTKTIFGTHSKHHLGRDTDGNMVNTKNASVSFAEALMIGYTVRNAASEVSLKGHKVTVKDSTGTDCQYVIRESYPDETLGLIVCILGDFE